MKRRRVQQRCRRLVERIVPECPPDAGRMPPQRRRDLEGALLQASGRRCAGADLRVSVIVSTVDRAPYLDRCLTVLRHLRHPLFEVIVVEGPSSDATGDILDRWGERIKRAACPSRNLSASRNLGVALAGGDLLAFIDDDAVAEPDWLDRLTEPFRDPEVVASGGAIRNWTGVRFQSRALTIDRGAVVRASTPEALAAGGGCPALTGTNFCVRREAVMAAGLFDEAFPYFLEESDLQFTLFAAKGRLAYADRAEVHHLRAANDHRGVERVPTSFETKFSSLSYFCMKHRAADEGRSAVVARLSHHLERAVAEIRRLRDGRRVRAEASAALLRSACRGLRRGIRVALAGAERAPAGAMPPSPFRPFPTIGPRAWRVAVIARGRLDEEGRAAIRASCVAASRPGREISVVMAGLRHEVANLHGCWFHTCRIRLALSWWTPGLSRRRAWQELRRVDGHRAFDAVIDVDLRERGARLEAMPFGPARSPGIGRRTARAPRDAPAGLVSLDRLARHLSEAISRAEAAHGAPARSRAGG